MTEVTTIEVPAEEAGISTEFLTTRLDIESRVIYVGNIEDGSADLFIQSMHLLLKASRDPIHLIINSSGGGLLDAFGMYDAIRTSRTTVTCEVYGHCMSAGVLIAVACDQRFIHKNALVMLHNPSHAGIEGDSFSVESWGKYAAVMREQVYNALTEQTSKPKTFWRRKCSKGDWIINPQVAVSVGLFDAVIEHDK